MKLKNTALLVFRILLLVIGFADLIGFLPPSLDIIDKGLAAIILFIYWLQLKPTKFLFGKENRLFDYLILIGFYLMVSDTFFQLIRIINYQLTVPILSYIQNSANAATLSLFTSRISFLFLIIISFLLARKIVPEQHSVLYSILTFKKQNRLWRRISSENDKVTLIIKTILYFIVLLIIGQYFFGLVNQWFIVSMDKSLFILAILFALKDLQSTKSKALNTIGNFDEVLLEKITYLFTTPKKIYLAFGMLLIFHYLSDLAVFFIPFLLNGSIDPFYLNLLGNESQYQNVWNLMSQEGVSFSFASLPGLLVYISSIIGVLTLILCPIIFIYLITQEKHADVFHKKRITKIIFGILIISMFIFMVSPWVKMSPLVKSDLVLNGIQGVDFQTQKISGHFFLVDLFILLTVGLIFWLFSLKSENLQRYGIIIGSFMGLYYFGKYIFFFFLSSLSYHINAINQLLLNNAFFLASIFLILLVLEVFFYLYIGLKLIYQCFRYIINELFYHLISDSATILWTIILLGVPFIFLDRTYLVTSFSQLLETIFSGTLVSGLFLMMSYAMYQEFRGSEQRDDYIFGVSYAIAIYQIILLVSIFFHSVGLNEGLINLLQPFIILIFAIWGIKLLHLKFSFKNLFFSKKLLFISIIMGFLFGGLFFIINEPPTQLISNNIIIILLYTFVIAVSEELIFRFIISKLAQRVYSYHLAIIIQAFIFSIIHFAGFRGLMVYYYTESVFAGLSPVIPSIIYFMLLFIFSIVQGLLVGKTLTQEEYTGNISYAIVLHWITNFVRFIL